MFFHLGTWLIVFFTNFTVNYSVPSWEKWYQTNNIGCYTALHLDGHTKDAGW